MESTRHHAYDVRDACYRHARFFSPCGSYTAVLLKLDPGNWSVLCALLLACFTTAINCCGVEKLGAVNEVVVVLTICLIAYISASKMNMLPTVIQSLGAGPVASVSAGHVWLAMSIVFWAFQGWESMTFSFEEIENARVNIPLIYWMSYGVVSLIYIVFALAVFAGARHGSNVTGLSGVTALLPEGIAGRAALVVMVFILVANANAWVFGSSRAFLSAAQLRLLPAALATLNGKGVPVRMLTAALVLYLLVILAIWYFAVEVRYAFLMTTQGFIVLYGGAVIAFMRETKKWWQQVIGLIAGSTWVFLIQGFGWMLLYPIGIAITGIVIASRSSPNNR